MLKTATTGKKQMRNFFAVMLMAGIIGISVPTAVLAEPPPGVTTAPYTIPYSGKLFDALGAPVTTAHNIRLSLWTDADVDAGDFLGSGALNTGSAGYAGWNEVHTVTPDVNGVFFVELGSTTTLPNFTQSTHKFLQVDVKENGLPLTSYETLDPDGTTTNTNDRHAINSVAFAINADTVDNADVGSGAGDLVVLDAFSRFPVSTIPGGTNTGTFVLDADNTIAAPDSIKIQFGTALAKILEYDLLNARFNFNDTLNIEGDLTVEGTINNVTINTDTVGLYDQSLVFRPVYADAVTQRDGTNNMGTLSVNAAEIDDVNRNYYIWETKQTSLQDIDIVLRATIPEGFAAWQSVPLKLSLQTLTDSTADNKIEVMMLDTANNPVTLNGATNLAESEWTQIPITFSGDPLFEPGKAVTIIIKMSAKNTGHVFAGKLSLHYNGR